jgi:hypothetical protein
VVSNTKLAVCVCGHSADVHLVSVVQGCCGGFQFRSCLDCDCVDFTSKEHTADGKEKETR